VSCEPEKVTALVDGALAAREAASLEEHLAACPPCRALADADRAVRRRLHGLPAPELPSGLEPRLRARLRAARSRRVAPRLLRFALPVAAVLALALWARGVPAVVAWQLVNDHRHCFSYSEPPAAVRSSDPAVVAGWFAGQGTPLPRVPPLAGSARLFGGRYCYFPDLSVAPHVYYTGGSQPLSVFVLAHDARFGGSYETRLWGRSVALLRLGESVVGVVGEDAADVDATAARLRGDADARKALAALAGLPRAQR
jgi:anti-sigma factor RsiW